MNDATLHVNRDSASAARSVEPAKTLTLRGGGWVIVLAGLITIGLAVSMIVPALNRFAHHPPGDGKSVESYAFDLANLNIPRDEIFTNVMMHRDMVPVMFDPTHSGPTSAEVSDPARWRDMQKRNEPKYGKYLVSSDRVIGVEINGQARCYPISVINVHEVANDVLGEPPVPIAVTYNWPCDAVVVLDRRVEHGGSAEELTFGISGLVYNSDTLLYNTRPSAAGATDQPASIGGESLFCPIQARGVSGIHAGASLKLIPASLTTWHDWSTAHPHTTVLNRDLSMTKRYKEAAPTKYFQNPVPLRPVKPSPPEGPNSLPAKTPMIIIEAAADGGSSARLVLPVASVIALADEYGVWTAHIDGRAVRFIVNRDAHTVAPERGQQITVRYAFWFAWHAMFPDDPVTDPRSLMPADASG